jgi:hypothetical protein
MNNALPFSVGWELEFALRTPEELRTISNNLTRAGIDNDYFGRWRRSPVSADKWDLKTDSSCGITPGAVGYEAVSPVIYNYTDLVRHATAAPLIRRNGALINERCGLHVHIGLTQHPDYSPLAVDRLIRFLNRYESAFYMLVPVSRRNNPYCKPIPVSIAERVRRNRGAMDIGAAWADKNTWVNFQTMSRIGTVEFRLFPGTLDKDEIVGTVMFLQQVMDCVISRQKEVQWGKARAKDSRMLFYTMLQQAGFYGKDFDPDRLKVARKWATSHFGKENRGTDPVAAPSLVVDEAEALESSLSSALNSPPRRRRPVAPAPAPAQSTASPYRVSGTRTGRITSSNVTPQVQTIHTTAPSTAVTPVWTDSDATSGTVHEVIFHTETEGDFASNEDNEPRPL